MKNEVYPLESPYEQWSPCQFTKGLLVKNKTLTVKIQKCKQNLQASISFQNDVWHLETYSHDPELHRACLHRQITKSITIKGFPGWKKFPGNVRTLYSLTNMLQPISAGSAWQIADPFVRRPYCSFEWHSWPSCWNSYISFEAAPLWRLTTLLDWSLSAARVS